MLCIEIYTDSIIMSTNEGGQVVRLFYSIFNNDTIYIIRLIVAPKYRRQNYGTEILQMLFDINKTIKTFIVVAKPDDIEYMSKINLLNFYNKFGFIFNKETDDGTLMIKTCIN